MIDSPQLVLNSSNTSGAPSSGLLLPEASPIFANPQSKSSEMLLAPSSEEIMAMSFCASEVEFEKNPTSVADKIGTIKFVEILYLNCRLSLDLCVIIHGSSGWTAEITITKLLVQMSKLITHSAKTGVTIVIYSY